MEEFATDLFEKVGVKTVTTTDKSKAAFVLNSEQKGAMSAAGYEPGQGGDNAVFLSLAVANDPQHPDLHVSYYDSMRQDEGRTPETRMGRDIVRWMEVGDEIAIGSIGKRIFAWKVGARNLSLNELGNNIASEADPKDILGTARKVKGKPPKQSRIVSDFRRNAAVVAGALSRAGGECEMPRCSNVLFARDDGRPFLEVHHIVMLAEGGDDTMANAAALCPMCHRELHYGANRAEKREILRTSIQAKES